MYVRRSVCGVVLGSAARPRGQVGGRQLGIPMDWAKTQITAIVWPSRSALARRRPRVQQRKCVPGVRRCWGCMNAAVIAIAAQAGVAASRSASSIEPTSAGASEVSRTAAKMLLTGSGCLIGRTVTPG
jgi:hypothetical protein